ncbi:NEAT domain-containing protein [Inediibacterium massiliense]|uniref:NEAT domain-containing protein n=1 Tax=Inediibacterium massiliense TaxID=1658111 RepID=UPI0006B56F67|nr:NEAT domain-containing protein [Inediibacterium massiliense]
MKSKVFKICTITFVIGALLLPSTQAFAQKGKVNKVNTTKKTVQVKEKEPLKIGKYTVSADVLKINADELSIAGQYMDPQAVLEVTKDKKKKEKKYIELKLIRSDWMKNVKVTVDGKNVDHTSKVTKTYKEKNEEGKNKTDSTIRFEIPKLDSKIKLGMTVVPMGNADVEFRVQLQDDITKLQDKAVNKNTPKSNKVVKKKK